MTAVGNTIQTLDTENSEADPWGLIKSFALKPPAGKLKSDYIFVLWRLSHRCRNTPEAAQKVLDQYGSVMAASESGWVKELLGLFSRSAEEKPHIIPANHHTRGRSRMATQQHF